MLRSSTNSRVIRGCLPLLALASSVLATPARAEEALRYLLFPNANGKYELPRHLKLDHGCGLVPKDWTSDWDEDKLVPLPLGGVLRGFNLRVRHGKKCAYLQILLIPKDSTEDYTQLPGEWTHFKNPSPPPPPVPAEPKGLERHESRGEPLHLAELREATAVDDAWYYPSEVGEQASFKVKLPEMLGKQQYFCKTTDAGADSFEFPRNETEQTIAIGTAPDMCAVGKTRSQRIVRLPNDGLTLTAEERKATTFRLKPVRENSSQLGVEFKGKLATDLEFQTANGLAIDKVNGLAVDGFVPGRTPDCDGNACTVVFQAARSLRQAPDDMKFTVSVDSRGSRLLRSGAKNVYDPTTGEQLKSAKIHSAVVTTWALGESNHFLDIGISPDSTTPIPIPYYLSRLLKPDMRLLCDPGGANCARFSRTDNLGGYLTLNNDTARAALVGTEKQLKIALDGGAFTLQSDKGDAVNLVLTTDDCRYAFEQLTQVFSGLNEGEVLYRVTTNVPRCLCANLKAEAVTSEVTTRTTTFDDRQGGDCRDRGPKPRVLRIGLGAMPPAPMDADRQLRVKLGQEDNAAVARTMDGAPILMRVERAPVASEVTVSVEAGPSENPSVISGSVPVGAGLVTRLSMARRTGVPWQVSLPHLGNLQPELPNPFIAGAEIRVGTDARVLPSASWAGLDRYFLKAADVSDDDLTVIASLSSVGSDFVVPGRGPWSGEQEVATALKRRLSLGYISLPRAGVKTKRYLLPWNAAKAALVCDDDDPVRHSRARQPFHRDALRRCSLRFPLDRGVDAKFLLSHFPQRIKVSITKGADQTATPLQTIRESDAKITVEGDRSYLVVELDNLLGKLGPVDDYTQVALHVQHAPDGELGSDLPSPFAPPNQEAVRDAPLDVRLVIVPAFAFVSARDGGDDAYGTRLYWTATAGFSVLRSRNHGYVGTSSDYASKVQANFGYGVLTVYEPWNFSDNEPIIPVLAPQAILGLLGPTEFTGPTWYRGVAGVLGLGFRLPAAKSPSSTSTEAQSGLMIWAELSSGARDSFILSMLFGFNVSVGALAP